MVQTGMGTMGTCPWGDILQDKNHRSKIKKCLWLGTESNLLPIALTHPQATPLTAISANLTPRVVKVNTMAGVGHRTAPSKMQVQCVS